MRVEAAATASRHWFAASARNIRSVATGYEFVARHPRPMAGSPRTDVAAMAQMQSVEVIGADVENDWCHDAPPPLPARHVLVSSYLVFGRAPLIGEKPRMVPCSKGCSRPDGRRSEAVPCQEQLDVIGIVSMLDPSSRDRKFESVSLQRRVGQTCRT